MMKTFQTINKKQVQTDWLMTDVNDPSYLLNKPVLDATNLTAGTGIIITGIFPDFTISADNTSPLWNANQLQGTDVSNVAPTNGQVLLYNGVSWVPTTISTGGTGSVTSVDATTTNGNAAAITGGPITSIGTLNFTWQGTAAQYVTGDGTLATFPIIPSAAGFIQNQFTVAQIADYWITGNARLNSLAGTGYGMVVATATGTLERQALPVINNGTLTISSTGIATGSATFTANQSGNSTATINVPGTNLGSSISGNTVSITSDTGTGTSFIIPSLTEIDPIYVASIPYQMMYKGQIPDAQNLDDYQITGFYHQSLDGQASSGTNYPLNYAGKLEVYNSESGFIYQKYHSYLSSGNREFRRTFYGGSWSSWSEDIAGTGSVTSVDISASGALTSTGGPITTSGVINLGWTGTNDQYVLGDGTLANIPASIAPFNPLAGTGISLSGSYPNITFTNSLPDQIVSLTGTGATTVSGTYPNFTINSTDTDTTYTAGTGVSIIGNVISATGAFAENGVLTINTSGIATGTGTFSANQATNNTITLDVPGTDLTSSITGNDVTIFSSTGADTTFTLPAGATPTNVLAGTGISVTGSQPNLTVTNTAPDQVVTLIGTGATTISGTYPNFTITSTDTDTNTTYLAGTGLSLVGNTFNNTEPDQIVTITGSGATVVTGSYPNFTVSSTDTNTTYSAGTGLTLTGTVFSSNIVDTNFANTDLTFTADRIHNGSTFGLRFDNMGSFNVASATNLSFNSVAGSSIEVDTDIILQSDTNLALNLNNGSATTLINGSNISVSDKTHYLPNANGTYTLSVNNIAADINGNITLSIPTDTNFATTDLVFTGDRFHDADNYSLGILNLDNLDFTFSGGFGIYGTDCSFQLGSTFGSLYTPTGLIFKADSNMTSAGANLLTNNILGLSPDIEFPDNSGTLVMSVNGVMADTQGNVDLTTPPPGIPTFIAASPDWTATLEPESNDNYGTIRAVLVNAISGSSPGYVGSFSLSTPKTKIMVPNVTLGNSPASVGTYRSAVVGGETLDSFLLYIAKDSIPADTVFLFHYHIMGY